MVIVDREHENEPMNVENMLDGFEIANGIIGPASVKLVHKD